MFAFGGYSEDRKATCESEWKAKNVIPILYLESDFHANLHNTLHRWADAYGVGKLGKESIVNDFARADPTNSTSQDDFVGRILWALSDSSGLPARRFRRYGPCSLP